MTEWPHGERVALINERRAPCGPSAKARSVEAVLLDFFGEIPAGSVASSPGNPAVCHRGSGKPWRIRKRRLANPPSPSVFIPTTPVTAPTGRTLAGETQGIPCCCSTRCGRRSDESDKVRPLSRPHHIGLVLGFRTVQPRFNMGAFGFFGMLALVLASGIFHRALIQRWLAGLMKIGVRMALAPQRIHFPSC